MLQYIKTIEPDPAGRQCQVTPVWEAQEPKPPNSKQKSYMPKP